MAASDRFVRSAPKDGPFVLAEGSDATPKARRLVAASPATLTDDGPGSTLTIGVQGATSGARGAVKLTGQLGGSADAPDVRGVRVYDATVPELLGFGEVADGTVLARSGTSIVGVTPVLSGGGAMSGDLAMGGNKITNLASGTDSGDAATYGQLTAMLNGLDWQNSVLDKLDGPPSSPSTGARYLVGTGTGAWTGHAGAIAVSSAGASWNFLTPNNGWTVHVESTGRDYHYDGSAWVDMGASIDHGALLNLTSGNPHTQYQLTSARDQANGYAGLDASGLLTKAGKSIRVSADPGSPAPGEVWVNGSALKVRDNAGTPQTQVVEFQSARDVNGGYAALDASGYVNRPAKSVRTAAPGTPVAGEVWIDMKALRFRDNQGTPQTQEVEVVANRDQNNGYAGLDGVGNLNRPTQSVRVGADPGSPQSGNVWVNGGALKFRDAQGTPSTQTVEVVAAKNQNNGYAGLDGNGRVAAAQAPAKATYATGGAQALTPADIGAPPTARQVATGAGLSGGGDLNADRTIAIAAYCGIVSKDFDPATLSWNAGEVKVHQTYDAGSEGQFTPVAVRLPAVVNGALRTEVVFEFDDSSNAILMNASTNNPLDATAQDLVYLLMGDLNSNATRNGRRIRKISLQTRNSDGSNAVSNVDVGVFRLRAWAGPRGGGSTI